MKNYKYARDLSSEELEKWVNCLFPDSDDIEILHKAIEYDEENCDGEHELGECYADGFDNLFDETESFQAFLSACEDDDSNMAARCWVARCYLGGWGTECGSRWSAYACDEEQAKEYLEPVLEDEEGDCYNYALNYNYTCQLFSTRAEFSLMSRGHDLLESFDQGEYHLLHEIEYKTDEPEEFLKRDLEWSAQEAIEEMESAYIEGQLNDLNVYYMGRFLMYSLGFDGVEDQWQADAMISAAKADMTYYS